MKHINILLTCITLTSSLAFALDGLPYGTDSVRVKGGKIDVKGMHGESVNVDGGNIDVKDMNDQSVHTGGGNINVKGMGGQSVQTQGKANKMETRDENDDSDAKESAAAEDKD